MAYFFALCAIALWSTNAATANYVLETLPVEQVQFLQFLGAFTVFAFLRSRAFMQKTPRPQLTSLTWLLGLVGLTGTMMFQYVAFSIGPITEVNVIAYAWPLLVALFLVVFGSARHPLRLLALACAGFLGTTLVIGGSSIAEFHFSANLYGHTAAFLSALCMAIFSFGIGRTTNRPNDVLLPGAAVGLVITALWCIYGQPVWKNPQTILAGLYLGVGPMGLGYLFWSWALQRDATDQIAVLAFLTPISSTALLLSNGERMAPSSLVGAAIVFGCCALIGLQARQNRDA